MKRRLEALETDSAASEWVVPIGTRVYLTTIARLQALEDGKEPPLYSREEIEQMRRSDLDIAAGGGVVGAYRESGGLQSEEGQGVLDEWEKAARRRLAAAEGLPPERWHEVWGVVEEGEATM